MIQRHQRPSLRQELLLAQQELHHLFEQLKEIRHTHLTVGQAAEKMQTVLTQCRFPVLGSKLLMNQIETLKWSIHSQFELVVNKAELMYIESIMYDLNRLKNEERIAYFSLDDLRQHIDEINWKMSLDKESILNESHQMEDDMELMKFFQGVRNYQNWQQQLQKKSLHKLISYANQAQRQLAIKKGYEISKVVHILQKFKTNNLQLFFLKHYSHRKKATAVQGIAKAFYSFMRRTFNKMSEFSNQQTPTQFLKQLFSGSLNQKGLKILLVWSHFTKAEFRKYEKLKTLLTKVIEKRFRQHSSIFFKRVHTKPYLKIVYLHQCIEKIEKTSKIVALRAILKGLGVHKLVACKKITQVLLNIQLELFQELVRNSEHNQHRKPAISAKLKGKILLGLQRHSSKPIDLRKTFLNWHLKGSETKYAKQVYNIWLNGNISKLTFFMRLKNAVNESRRYTIKYELKLFLIMMCEKITKYYNFTQSGFLKKWQRGTKHLQIVEANKARGKDLFINFINHLSSQQQKQKSQLLEKFKQDFQRGKDIKSKLCTKAFQQDLLYMQKYIDKWRSQKNIIKLQEDQDNSEKWRKRKQSLRFISITLKRQQTATINDSITSFVSNSNICHKKRLVCKGLLSKFFNRTQISLQKSTFLSFSENWAQGKTKKQQLVTVLVHSNVVKQLKTLSIWKQKAIGMLSQDRIEKTKDFYTILDTIMKKNNFNFFKQRYVSKCLHKIIVNKNRNVETLFRKMMSVPPRKNWDYRKRLIGFVQKVSFFRSQNLVETLQHFRRDHLEGNFKKPRCIEIMAHRYYDVTKTYFNIYRNNVSQAKTYSQSKACTQLFTSLESVSITNFKTVFIAEADWVKKAKHIQKLDQWAVEKIKQAFYLWKEASKSLTYYDRIKDQKKTRCIQVLMDTVQKNRKSESLDIIYKFKKNLQIHNIQKHFLLKLLDTQVGKVEKIFSTWKALPVMKDKEQIARACKFEKKLCDFSNMRLKFTLGQFQEQLYKGNEKKRIVIRSLVSQSSVEIKDYLQKWRNNKNLSVLFDKCRKLERFLTVSQGQSQSHFAVIFKDGMESITIKSVLKNMAQAWKHQQKQFLFRWFRTTNGEKYKDFVKKNSIKNISYLMKKNESSKNQLGVRDFIRRSKFGLIISLFLRRFHIKNRRQSLRHTVEMMKNMPNLKEYQKHQARKKAMIRSVQTVQRTNSTNVRQLFQKFRFNRYQGQFKKQKAFSTRLKHKITRVSKIINDWNQIVREQKQKQKTKLLSQNFHHFEQICRSNFQQILTNRREFQIKTKVIEKLVRVQQIKFKGFFLLWKNNVSELKILSALQDKTKIMVLQKMGKLLENNSQAGTQKAVRSFYQNFRIIHVQKKFVNKLLQTKSGKVMEAFGKWKDIPNQNLMEKYRKGQKFYFRLEALQKNRLREVSQSFKGEFQEGNSLKKQSILQMFSSTSSGIRKFYTRWSGLTKSSKTIQTVKQTMNLMDTLQSCTATQFMILFENQRSYRIKTAAIQKLIAACGNTTKSYFDRWRQVCKQLAIQDQMDDQKKRIAVGFFNKVIASSENNQTIEAIEKFRINFRIKRVAQGFFNRLLMTKTGKMLKLMEQWKAIPNVKIAKKKKCAIIFQSRLNKYMMKFLRGSWQPFKDQNYNATNRKRYCIQRLLRLSQSDSRSKFDIWRNINREQKILAISRNFEKVFVNSTNICQTNFRLLIENSKAEVRIKQNLCKKLILNSSFVLHHAYFIWKEAHQIDNNKISREQGKVQMILKNFICVYDSVEKKQTIQTVNLFRNNMENFNRQRSVRDQDNLHQRCFKLYQLINSAFSTQKASFFEAIRTQQFSEMLVERVKATQNCFQLFCQIGRNNFMTVMRSNRESRIIERSLNKIFQNCGMNKHRTFDIWRQNSRILKIEGSISNEKKKNLLSILNRVMENQQGKQIPAVIQKFNKNMRINRLQREILAKILQCKAGKIPMTFMTWKNLPDPGVKKTKQLAMKFENGLYQFYSRKARKIFQAFKEQSYEANNRKKIAVRKLVLVTMSDSNRMFSKWRKVAGEMRITNVIKCFDNSASIMLEKSKEHFSLLFVGGNGEIKAKQLSIRKLVKNLTELMRNSLGIWRNTIQSDKVYVLEKVLDGFQPYRFSVKLKRAGFQAIKRKYELDLLRTYINSLWKWKSSNMEANYYSKFIKVFREGQELLNFSNLFNRKLNEHMHFSFRMISSYGQSLTLRKKHIVQKYFTKKLRHSFQALRVNILNQETAKWKDRFTSNIKGMILADLIAKLLRKQQSYFLSKICLFNQYHQAVGQLVQKIEDHRIRHLRHCFNGIAGRGYHLFLSKIVKFVVQTREKCIRQVFSLVKEFSDVNNFEQKVVSSLHKILMRHSLTAIRRYAQLQTEKKFSLSLLTQIHNQRQKSKTIEVVRRFKRKMETKLKLDKVFNLLLRKQKDALNGIFQVNKNTQNTQRLLIRFRKGSKIKKILEKQDMKLLGQYFERLRKKHNPWTDLSIRRFATKASLKSSIAVSLWRIKNLTEIKT